LDYLNGKTLSKKCGPISVLIKENKSGYGCLEFCYERSHTFNYPTTLKMKVVEIISIKLATFQNEVPRNS
jgi:hypothetical protein